MAISKDKKQSSGKEVDQSKTTVQSRRSVLKALAGVPVLGFFGWEVLRNSKTASNKKNRVLKELGLESLEMPVALKSPAGNSGNLLRIGMIGFGSRAHDLAKGLGFMHPEDVEAKKKDKSLEGWLEQEYLGIDCHWGCTYIGYIQPVCRNHGSNPGSDVFPEQSAPDRNRIFHAIRGQ